MGDLPAVPKFVAIVVSHTSNWDSPVGVLVMFALDLDVHWFGKDTLFRSPLGPLFRRLGGRPVNRATPEGVIDEMAAIVRAKPQLILALARRGHARASRAGGPASTASPSGPARRSSR